MDDEYNSGSWIRLGATATGLQAQKINAEIRGILGKNVESITKRPEVRQLIGDFYVSAVTPYVPRKSGALRLSGRATEDGRVYWSAVSGKGFNYAEIQYYGISSKGHYFTHYTTPGTTHHWNRKVAPGTYDWSRFIERIAHIIKEEFK